MSWQPVPFLSQINSVYAVVFCLITIRFDYYPSSYAHIHRFTSFFMFICWNFIFISRHFHACCTSFPLNPHWYDLPNNIQLKLKSCLCNYLYSLLSATFVSSFILGSETLGDNPENPEKEFLSQPEIFCPVRTPFTLPSEISRLVRITRTVVKFARLYYLKAKFQPNIFFC
jgi:hypothetical protein